LSTRQAADSVVGDIQEQLHDTRTAGRGPRFPRLSLNLLLAAAIAAALATSIPRLLQAAGSIVGDACRTVRRTPSHAAMVIGVLAIGITAGTVTFSVVDAVLFRPLPIKDGDRLVYISSFDPATRKERLTGETFWQLHDHTQTLESVAPFGRLHGDSSSIAGLTDEFPITFTTADAYPESCISRPVSADCGPRAKKPVERRTSPCSVTASGGATSAAGRTSWA
jgi:hypothetical protein